MIQYTENAQLRLKQYLQELRRVLGGCQSIDSGEVERDVMEHIENSLAGASVPVDRGQLDGVLQRLGSPMQWLPDEEFTWRQRLQMRLVTMREWFRNAVSQLWTGPEDWRLAYLSLLTFVLSPLLIIFAPFGILLSFCFARAAVSLAGSPAELGPRRWLVYPVLLFVYIPLAAVLLFWTIPYPLIIIMVVMVEQLDRPNDWPLHAIIFAGASHALLLFTSLWWMFLGWIAGRHPGWVRNTFYPFATNFTGRRLRVLGWLSLVVFVLSIISAVAMGVMYFDELYALAYEQ